MRVLILANDAGGLYDFRKELMETLLKDKQVFVVCPYDEDAEKIKELGCEYIDISFNRKGTNPIKDIALLNTYRRLIREIKPNVVLTYTIKPNVYGGLACQAEKVPYIANITGLGLAIENGGLLSLISSTLYKIGLRKANCVFFQNESNKNYMLSKGIVKDNYRLVPGSGVNLSRYKLLEYPNSNIVNFVFVARLVKEKGIELYLNAAEKIHDKYPNTLFNICGADEDGYIDRVKELETKGIVKYHGLVDNMIEVYKNMNCTIHPSYYAEGLSNVLLESCASGRPIVTTDKPGCKEVVDNGVNGYIVKQKDEEDLVSKIEAFMQLSKVEMKKMGINARRKVEKEFDRNIVINSYLDVINKL